MISLSSLKMGMRMIIPPALKKGDKIGVVSPAGKISSSDVLPAVEWLRAVGYEVILGEHIFNEYNLFSGNDLQRAADFQQMLDDSEVKVLLSARGGYGCLRTWQQLDFSRFLKMPKWVVGFSDVTVFHSYLNTLGIASLHGVMPRFFLEEGEPSESLNSLMRLLKRDSFSYLIPPHPLNRSGEAVGELIGGNLSILYSLRGTPLDVDTRGKILFIEDLSEFLYHLDRIMQNFKVGGVFDQLAGVIVGAFTEMNDSGTPFGKEAVEIIAEALEDYNFPVCFGFPAGHVQRNLALPFGQQVQLNLATEQITLSSVPK